MVGEILVSRQLIDFTSQFVYLRDMYIFYFIYIFLKIGLDEGKVKSINWKDRYISFSKMVSQKEGIDYFFEIVLKDVVCSLVYFRK